MHAEAVQSAVHDSNADTPPSIIMNAVQLARLRNGLICTGVQRASRVLYARLLFVPRRCACTAGMWGVLGGQGRWRVATVTVALLLHATCGRGGAIYVLKPKEAFPRDVAVVEDTDAGATCPAMAKDSASLVFLARRVDADAGTLAASGLELGGVPCSGGEWELLDADETAELAEAGTSFNESDPIYQSITNVLSKTNTLFPDLYVLHARVATGGAEPTCTVPGGGRVPVSRFVMVNLVEAGYLGPLSGVDDPPLVDEGFLYIVLELGAGSDERCIWAGSKLWLDPTGGRVTKEADPDDDTEVADTGDDKSSADTEDGHDHVIEKVGIVLGVVGTLLAIVIIAIGGRQWRRRTRRDESDQDTASITALGGDDEAL